MKTAASDRSTETSIEPSHGDAAMQQLHARLAVGFSLVAAGCGLVYLVLYLAMGMPVTAVAAAVAFATGLLGLVAHQAGVQPDRIGHLLGGCFVVVIALGAMAQGGTTSTVTGWFVLAPLLPAVLGGRRAGLMWGVPPVLALLAMLAMETMGVGLPNELPEWAISLNAWAVSSGLVVAVACIAVLHEYESGLSHRQILAMSDEVLASRDTAQEAHAAARQLLDIIGEGLVLVRPDGRLEAEHSRAVERLVGPTPMDTTLWGLFGPCAPELAEWLQIAWEDLELGLMPCEVVLDQLPATAMIEGRQLAISYTPILIEGRLERVLVVIRDDTARLAAEAEAALQRELLHVFMGMLNDRAGTQAFVADTTSLVARLGGQEGTEDEEGRWLHTLKGNCATFGLHSVAGLAHELEDLRAEQGALGAADWDRLERVWQGTLDRLEPVLCIHQSDAVSVDRATLDATVELALSGAPRRALADRLQSWAWRRVDCQLDQLAKRMQSVAQEVGKGHVVVRVDADVLRVPPEPRWDALIGSLVHVVRNAVDHGVEGVEERRAAGKADTAVVELAAYQGPEGLVIEVRDDGPGVNWDVVASRGRARGLPVHTHDDLVSVLFHDGVSTRDVVTKLSGRGVGTSAVLEAAEALQGSVDVLPGLGGGTTFRIVVPLPTASDAVELAS